MSSPPMVAQPSDASGSPTGGQPPTGGRPPGDPPTGGPPTGGGKPPGGAGPADPPARRRRDPLWARLLVALGALLLLTSGSLIGATKVLTSRYEGKVQKETLLADGARPEAETRDDKPQPARLTGPLNFLLLGSDFRAGSADTSQRTDTIIVAHVPASLDRVYLISIPRDLRVQIPPNPATNFSGSREKINSAFEYGGGGNGGVQLLSATLANLLGIRFDGAALIDFTGFMDVVKALGGVDMCIDHRVVSEHVGWDRNGKYLHPRNGGTPMVYEPGCRELNHWQALDYVRQRHSLPDGDYGRQRHQQQFLKAVLTRARDKGVVTNPIKLDQLIRAVAGTLTVDTGRFDLDDLIFGLRDIRPGDITGITIPSEPQWIGNTSYIVAFDAATALYQALAGDTLDAWATANPHWVNSL